MSWGIAETASEIEKIKSESADYLNGLNSCGVIDWDTYNYAFDFYMDLLMEAYRQGQKDAQQEDYTKLKREFLRMASYIDVLLECSDEQKETLIGFISRLAEFMPWTERD